ncbi:putative bifunctional diguanylate cyclase/phosphodiesterase [Ensifer adhaerens]|uniref:putative bifunctional diguanylate cyclase/phosphodiesterase n=1 Tax=Ensifer adhaerens TaxID=106592 RepID=UPI001C4E06A2|nr:EAL domain-containing protein [Ensifer adhaerens]MBW0370161.1 EAL domain-containing protein [Ensifer adhaerens]UCM19220.1 EAL domain-containing protein [Ensifer adhaerens]
MMRLGQSALPTDVYLSSVSSLYEHRKTLVIGMLSHVVTFLLVYLKTSDPLYLACSGVIFVLWALRNLDMARFDRQDFSNADRAMVRKWENRYIVGGVSVTLTCGIACGYAIAISQDSFSELATISVTLASMISLVGRNYGSERAVLLLSSSACLPIVIGLLTLQDVFMLALAVLILPFILSTWMMANNVRAFLYENVMAAREIATIAGQFDTALNNMTHGLFMLDADGRVVVANERACELLALGDRTELKGWLLDDVIRRGARRMRLDPDKTKAISRQLDLLLKGKRPQVLIPVSEELHLEFSASRRDNGDTVLIFEDVTARVQAEKQILHMVRFDKLTQLPSRDYFGELVQATVSADDTAERLVGLMVLDVTEFKHVNDMRGHIVGDRLLHAIAGRLRVLAGDDAIVARLMGDEFVVFIPGGSDAIALEERMRGLHADLRDTYEAGGFTFSMTMSAGIVIASSLDLKLEDLQIKADLALSETKLRNRGGCTAFEAEMDARYVDRQKLKADLREAINAGSLTLSYQPMFAPNGGRVECCEALARWTHPERGPVPPNVFIQLAEELGLVTEITRFVLDQACRDCMNWPGDVSVSVNLSVLDLRSSEIVVMVTDALRVTGLDAARLHLEVTESCLMDEPLKVQAILRELRGLGITIAIDDFGTGYSSLSYLDALPVDIIKIDRSFVRNIREDSRRFKLLRGTANLARALGLRIVVEGVETADQLQLINEHNCADLIQGFVFAAPMPASAIATLCKNGVPKRGTKTTSKRIA